MKKIIYGALVIVILVILGLAILDNNSKKEIVNVQNQTEVTPRMHTVKALESVNTSGYTYIKVAENSNEYWIAVNKMDVKKDQVLYFAKSMEMKNFHSTELNRTFESVLFVDGIATSADQAATNFQHPEINPTPNEAVKVDAYPGGKTVKDVYADKAALNGKVIKIRGKVVKVNTGIMDRNWVHIQDGTSNNGEYDLLVTTGENVNMGDIVSFEGKVAINQDFGAGYAYSVLIENAKIIKENKNL